MPTREPEWGDQIEVRDDPALAAELVARLPPAGSPRALPVTDLVALRPSFWSRVAPVPPTPERAERLERGRFLHRRLGPAIAPHGALEVRLCRAGVVGRIDALTDVPIELKTGATSVPSSELLGARPEQLEQLAMYAGLVDRGVARLVSVGPSTGPAPDVQVTEVEIPDRAAVRAEIARRRDRLRAALHAGAPTGLPRCPWRGRGCEFQAAGTCDCSGEEASEPSALLPVLGPLRDRADLAEEIRDRIRSPPEGVPPWHRFRDLLYLRRTYFERVQGSPPEAARARRPDAPADLYERVREAMESGPIGEVASLPSRSDEVEEDVPAFRGLPWIERVTRGWERPDRATLLERYPQYLLELGFRSIAVGASSARLLLGWERGRDDAERVQAFEVRLGPPTTFARLWRERARRLEHAIRDRAPTELEPCPEWMAATCPYAATCGCADDAGRSQR